MTQTVEPVNSVDQGEDFVKCSFATWNFSMHRFVILCVAEGRVSEAAELGAPACHRCGVCLECQVSVRKTE